MGSGGLPWWIAASVAASMMGGCQSNVFECESSSSCLRDGTQGICQPDGWCSFPDPSCPSGQRYGEHAGDGKASTCVDVDQSDGTMGGATSTGAHDTSSGVSTSSAEDLTSDSSVMTTSDASGSSSGASTTSSDDGTTSDDTTDTQGPIVCTLSEVFEGNALDDGIWTFFTYGGASLVVQNGRLHIVLVGNAENAGVIHTQVGDLHEQSVTWILGSGTNPATSALVRLSLDDGTTELRMTYTQGDLVVETYDGSPPVELVRTALDLDVHDHLRFAFSGETLRVQRSNGGGNWDTVWQGEPPIALESVTLATRAGGWPSVPNPGEPSFEAIHVCDDP